jgi:hypothetical protein
MARERRMLPGRGAAVLSGSVEVEQEPRIGLCFLSWFREHRRARWGARFARLRMTQQVWGSWSSGIASYRMRHWR